MPVFNIILVTYKLLLFLRNTSSIDSHPAYEIANKESWSVERLEPMTHLY